MAPLASTRVMRYRPMRGGRCSVIALLPERTGRRSRRGPNTRDAHPFDVHGAEEGPATLRRTITERVELVGRVIPRGSTEFKPGVFVSQNSFALADSLFPPGTIGRAPRGQASGGRWSIPVTTSKAKPRTTGSGAEKKTTTAVDTTSVQLWYIPYVPPAPPKRALGTRTG